MNIEHGRGPAELEYIPDSDGLDGFDAETAGLVPAVVRPQPARAPSRSNSGDLPLYPIEGNEISSWRARLERHAIGPASVTPASLFAIVDAAAAFDREPAASRLAPRVAGAVLKAALVSGLFVMGMVTLPAPVEWRSSPPSLLEARHTAVETLALAAAPTIPASAGSGMHNVPAVYRKPSVAPAGPAGNRLRITEIPGDVDIQTIRGAFARLSSQNLPFEHCDVQVLSADHAMARCRGKLGDLSAWRMDLSRNRERWQLVPDSSTN